MATASEKSITRQIVSYLRMTEGSWWVKIVAGPFQQSGLPDIIGCLRGRFYAFEVKRPGGKLTPSQAATLDSIEKGGGVAAVVHSIDETRRVLGGELLARPVQVVRRKDMAGRQNSSPDAFP